MNEAKCEMSIRNKNRHVASLIRDALVKREANAAQKNQLCSRMLKGYYEFAWQGGPIATRDIRLDLQR